MSALGDAEPAPSDSLPFNPRTYAVQRAPTAPQIDGRLTDAVWAEAEWMASFVDARGPSHPDPQYRTRTKMAWDDQFLYIAAQLEEPHVRASFTTRDTTIWRENAFELFIDPTGDTHHYYEFQINARETHWDLMLTKPYRDDGTRISAWDIRGLRKAVSVRGTLNDPSDTDEGWTVELALPWTVLEEAAPEARPPRDGEQWRVNLTRMQWPATIRNGSYVQDTTNAGISAWSPQGGSGNYHKPERWGIVQFSDRSVGAAPDSVRVPPNEHVKWALRRLYERQSDYRDEQGTYAASLDALNAADIALDGRAFEPTLHTTPNTYEITAPGADGTTVHIRQDGKVWTTDD